MVARRQLTVFDSSVIYTLLDASEPAHHRVLDWYRRTNPAPVTTPLVLAEVDHLTATRLHPPAQTAWRADIAAGAYTIEWWHTAPRETAHIADQYADTGLAMTDASLIALAARLDTNHIATLDERHFRTVTPLTRFNAFHLLPTDDHL